MDEVTHRARFDWLVEFAGAAAPGLAAAFAAHKLAPSFGFDPGVGLSAAGMAAFALGLLAMRAVKPEAREHRFAALSLHPIGPEEMADVLASEPLLLEVVYDGSNPFGERGDDSELLLDDPLIAHPDSRVVQLFASQPMPTAGELKKQIDRHLAAAGTHPMRNDEGPAPDASAALYEALADLRRSLR